MDMMLGDSPMVTGTWYNPKTGHSFTAKDTYFEDNNMYVLTTDGQRIDGNMLSQYVQSNRPMEDKRDFSKPQPAQAVLPPEVKNAIIAPETPQSKLVEGLTQTIPEIDAQFITEEDKALIAGTGAQMPMGNPVNPGLGNIHQPEDEDALLVRRMLKRAEHPLIDCKISWKGFPTKQMDMLDTMGVDYEKIADFYMKDLDIKSIQDIIKNAIVTYIEKRMIGDEEPKDSCAAPIEQEEIVVEKTQPKEIKKEEVKDAEPEKPMKKAVTKKAITKSKRTNPKKNTSKKSANK